MKKLFIVAFILLVSCTPSSKNSTKSKQGSLEQLQKDIDELYNSEIDKDEPGAALLVIYNGKKIINKGYGLRDLETKEPITPSTNMRTASITKQFTALNIMSLVDQNLIKISDTVFQYFPLEVFKKITIQHLLNHTSGIADYDAAFMANWDRSKIVNNQEVLKWLATNPTPSFEPGDLWEYSNTAYVVLALLVEKVSGQEFSSYAKENVFDKANMAKTNFYSLSNPIEIDERAYCYEKDSLDQWQKVDGFFLNGIMGDGGLYTSMNDYFNYDQKLRSNSIVSESSHKLIFKPTSTEIYKGNELPYSMGWWVKDNIASHTGGWYGTTTFVKRSLEKPLTIAIFKNTNTLFETNLIKKTDDLVLQYLEDINQ